MDIIPANDVQEADLCTLVDKDQTIDHDELRRSGYVIKHADILEGCFVLDEKEDRIYWLRQMYMTQNAVTSLPALLEAVLALAAKKQAERVVIYSHQQAVDTILEALQFFPQNGGSAVDNVVDNGGKWWAYSIPS